MEHIAPRLAEIPGVVAVTLGGSRATGEARPDSDWDFGLYYTDTIDPADVEALGWSGEVRGPRGWGPVVNGGAWLTIDGVHVDLCYRDLEEVNREVEQANQGQFQIWHLPSYVAGIPTYVLVGELALGRVLAGELPRPTYPSALARRAPLVWRGQGSFTLHSAEVHASRDDTVAAVANMARAVLMEAHARMAERRQWVLSEKRLVDRAGLGEASQIIGAAGSTSVELLHSIRRIRAILDYGE